MVKSGKEEMKLRGARIRQIRREKYVSSRELYEFLGISPSSYVRIEEGRREMRCFEAIKIAEYLNVPVLKILCVEPKPIVSDKVKKMAVNSGFDELEVNRRLHKFAAAVVESLHI